MNDWLALGLAIGVCFGAAAVGSWATVRGDALAAALFVPYLAWATFASFLNGALARLNPAS